MIKFNRKITNSEIKQARKSYRLLIVILPTVTLISWVLLFVDKIPQPARIVGLLVCLAILLIFIYKQITLEKELKKGLVEEIEGLIKSKTKLGTNGKSDTAASGKIIGASHLGSSSYIFTIEKQSFWVKPKQYHKVRIGEKMRLVYLPKTQLIVSISII